MLSCLRSPGRLCWLIVLGRFTNCNVLVTDLVTGVCSSDIPVTESLEHAASLG